MSLSCHGSIVWPRRHRQRHRPSSSRASARRVARRLGRGAVRFTRGRSRLLVSGRQDGQSCEETRELLEELVGLSDKLHLTPRDVDAEPAAATLYNVTAVPTVIVRRRASAKDGTDANVRSIFEFTCVCEMPSSWYSTGSSTVRMLMSGELISDRHE